MQSTAEHPAASPLPRRDASSRVLATLPERDQALAYFTAKLACETDPADVYADLQDGIGGFVVVDARSPELYAQGHIPGAISFPHRQMDPATTATLHRGKVYVVYCDGIGCNASSKGAAKLTALGFYAKEMLGGLDWWRRDGYAVEQGGQRADEESSPSVACGC